MPVEDTREYRYASHFQERFIPKYQAGRAEHGTVLTDRELYSQIEDEVLDLWAYVQGLKEQRRKLLEILCPLLETMMDPRQVEKALEQAINILTVGNAQGIDHDNPTKEEE